MIAIAGKWNVAQLKQQHSKWLSLFDASNQRTMLDIGATAVHFAQQNPKLKIRTGAYRAGWSRKFQKTTNKITIALVGRAAPNLYHEVGTGIYGPKKQRIFPRHAKFLRWVDPDTGQVKFARSVRGVRPTWHGRKSTFNAWTSGRTKLLRESQRLAAKF